MPTLHGGFYRIIIGGKRDGSISWFDPEQTRAIPHHIRYWGGATTMKILVLYDRKSLVGTLILFVANLRESAQREAHGR